MTHRQDLARGRRAYEQDAHERTLAVLRAMEPRVRLLAPTERVQYAWLRGMSDYRLGYRLDARHWLSLASAMAEQTQGSLTPEWRAQMDEALAELDGHVFEKGYDGLANVLRAHSDRAPAAKPKRKSDTADDEP